MQYAFDTITQQMVSADDVSKSNINEPFRYECICCGEEVHIAAAQSKKRLLISAICMEIVIKTANCT